MSYEYELTIQDYMDYNYFYVSRDKRLTRNRTINRLFAPVAILISFLLELANRGFNPISFVIYVILACVVYVLYPMYEKKRMDNQVKLHFKRKGNGGLGKKVFTFEEDTFSQEGENFTDRTPYTDIKSFEKSDKHFFIFTDEMSAFIIPFRSFKNDTDKDGFELTLNSIIGK